VQEPHGKSLADEAAPPGAHDEDLPLPVIQVHEDLGHTIDLARVDEL